MTAIIDASALLAVLQNENGGDIVLRSLRHATISAVNLSETIVKAGSVVGRSDMIIRMIDRFDLRIVAFGRAQAIMAAEIRDRITVKGVSFADRACLALGLELGLPILTGDRQWAELDLGIDIRLIR